MFAAVVQQRHQAAGAADPRGQSGGGEQCHEEEDPVPAGEQEQTGDRDPAEQSDLRPALTREAAGLQLLHCPQMLQPQGVRPVWGWGHHHGLYGGSGRHLLVKET